ncbi:MAG: GGDEF domain-containing protein, partial [Myxococcota bacterium]
RAGALVLFEGDEIVIGRGQDATERIDDSGLSRRHARIYRRSGAHFIQDLGSTNGTYVNGVPVVNAVPLGDGDRIQLGRGVIFRSQLLDDMEHEAQQRLYDAAVRDPLTKLYNRRHLDDRLREEFAFAARHRSALSVILTDIDRFKSVNDTYGHPAGDEVLRRVATAFASTIRIEDMVARYGGEEFCIVLRGIEACGAMTLAGRLRKKVEELPVDVGQVAPLHVTSSFGVATFDHLHPFVSQTTLVEAADAALYIAKDTGRNRCVHASDPGVMPSR